MSSSSKAIFSQHRLCTFIWRWLTALLIQFHNRSYIHNKYEAYSSSFALEVYCSVQTTHFFSSQDSWARSKNSPCFTYGFLKAPITLTFSNPNFGGHAESKSLTHQIPQTPGWSSSRPLWCAAGFFPECPNQSGGSYTAESPHCTCTSSHRSGKQTGLQTYSQCSLEPPE